MPIGDNIVAPEQYVGKGAGYGDLGLAVGGGDLSLNQLVDDRVADACVVAAAMGLRRLARPEVALFVTRTQGLAPVRGNDIVVEVLYAVLVLGRVDRANGGGDAEALEILHHRTQDPLVRR